MKSLFHIFVSDYKKPPFRRLKCSTESWAPAIVYKNTWKQPKIRSWAGKSEKEHVCKVFQCQNNSLPFNSCHTTLPNTQIRFQIQFSIEPFLALQQPAPSTRQQCKVWTSKIQWTHSQCLMLVGMGTGESLLTRKRESGCCWEQCASNSVITKNIQEPRKNKCIQQEWKGNTHCTSKAFLPNFQELRNLN